MTVKKGRDAKLEADANAWLAKGVGRGIPSLRREPSFFFPNQNAQVRGVSMGKPRVPVFLRKRGKALWHSVIEVGEPNPAELAILTELCSAVDEIDDLRAILRQSSPVVQGSTGQPRPNPLYGELRRHRELADRLARSLAVPGEVDERGTLA